MKLTRRGERVFTALLVGAGLVVVGVILYLSTHIHFTGPGFCFGSFVECFGEVG